MEITVYGADWCAMTQRTLVHLRSLGIEHDYVDIDDDEEARAWVRAQNGGREKKPTVKIGDRILTEPTDEELDRALESTSKR